MSSTCCCHLPHVSANKQRTHNTHWMMQAWSNCWDAKCRGATAQGPLTRAFCMATACLPVNCVPVAHGRMPLALQPCLADKLTTATQPELMLQAGCCSRAGTHCIWGVACMTAAMQYIYLSKACNSTIQLSNSQHAVRNTNIHTQQQQQLQSALINSVLAHAWLTQIEGTGASQQPPVCIAGPCRGWMERK